MNHGDSSELCELGVEHGTRKVSTPREGSSAQMAGGWSKRQKTRKDDYFFTAIPTSDDLVRDRAQPC